MGELLSVIRAEEKQNKALRFEKYLLVLIVVALIACTLVMISDIKRLQGTARVVNYAGIVRGATQRLVKLEMNGFTNQVLEDRINNIIFGLKNGSETFNLVRLEDQNYQNLVEDTITIWNAIRAQIVDVRLIGGGGRDELISLSEQHFSLADQMVSSAEVYSQKIATNIERTETGITVCLLVIATIIFHQLLHAVVIIGRNRDFKQKDIATGLYKKYYFYEHADNEIVANPKNTYTAFCAYVEHYNVLNERYSYQKCNTMMKDLAELLQKHIPDCVLAGRLQEDTFAFLLDKQPDDSWLDKIREVIDQDFLYPVSVKFSVYDQSRRGLSMSKMCDRMVLSLENIKDNYGSDLIHYDEKLLEQAHKEHLIQANMENALKDRQFKAYFQPKHSLHTDKTGGAEVLVRWIHPEMGFMNPGDFIPLFESNGFIAELDYYIWEEACRALRKWRENGMPLVPLSVNMSRRDFAVPGLVAKIINLADNYELPHSLLHFEVTESSISTDPEKLSGIVKELHEAGFVIELDDFGSGYSSMNTLNELTLDVLKLDMSLIRKDNALSDNSVLKFAVMLGKMLGLQVVSEGVETKEQVERLKELDCDYVQGYYYSRPLPQADFEVYLAKETV
jgi:EAL domain-containing protein (putative c-di-GMP-specific phosphodiesterase class I)